MALCWNALVEVIESSNPYYPFTSTSVGRHYIIPLENLRIQILKAFITPTLSIHIQFIDFIYFHNGLSEVAYCLKT
jgi:hypothetical protein